MIVMRPIRLLGLIAVLLAILPVLLAQVQPSHGQGTAEPTQTPQASINGFHLVSSTEGWLWLNHLYWTKDSGQTWTDITPPALNGMLMWAVTFIDG
jgi:hypothetical protein